MPAEPSHAARSDPASHELAALRARVRRSVSDRHPIDDDERASITAFLGAFDALADPFDEHADRVHVTGSAIVVGVRGVVLLRHRRLGTWLQPGGHIDPGEAPWEAARREAAEETGLDVAWAAERLGGDGLPELIHVDVHPGGRGHTHLDLRYLLRASDADPAPPPGESQEIAWFGWDAAIERASDARLRSLLSALRD